MVINDIYNEIQLVMAGGNDRLPTNILIFKRRSVL